MVIKSTIIFGEKFRIEDGDQKWQCKIAIK